MAGTLNTVGEQAVTELRKTANNKGQKTRKMSAAARDQALREKREAEPDVISLNSSDDGMKTDDIKTEKKEKEEIMELNRARENADRARLQSSGVTQEPKKMKVETRQVAKEAPKTDDVTLVKDKPADNNGSFIQENESAQARDVVRPQADKMVVDDVQVKSFASASIATQVNDMPDDSIKPETITQINRMREINMNISGSTPSVGKIKNESEQLATIKEMNRISAEVQTKLAQAYMEVSEAKKEAKKAQDMADMARKRLEIAKQTAMDMEEKASKILNEYVDFTRALAQQNEWSLR